MKTILVLIVSSFIALCISNASAQSDENVRVPSKIESTKTIQVDADKNSAVNYESSKKDLMKKYGLSSEEVDKYIKQDKMNVSDIYQAGALSEKTGKSVSEVMKSYEQNKSWEKTSQHLGIKSDTELSPNGKGTDGSETVKKSNGDQVPSANEIKKNDNVKKLDQPKTIDSKNSKSTK